MPVGDASPPATDDPLIGTVVSERYRIIRKVGEGGMGAVYQAEHALIEKRVALKILFQDLTRRPDLVARFLQEAKSASRIGQENVIDISDFGQSADGLVYIAMEFLDGQDLGKTLRAEKQLPWTAHPADPDADRQGAARGAQPRDHPPRHEARERLPRAARGASGLRQGARLRHRQGGQRRRQRGAAPHPDRDDLRDARVHVARAGAGTSARSPRRRLRRRLHHVPHADRRRSVHRRQLHGDPDQAPARAGGAAAQAPPRARHPVRRRGDLPARDGEGLRQALARHGRLLSGARRGGRRALRAVERLRRAAGVAEVSAAHASRTPRRASRRRRSRSRHRSERSRTSGPSAPRRRRAAWAPGPSSGSASRGPSPWCWPWCWRCAAATGPPPEPSPRHRPRPPPAAAPRRPTAGGRASRPQPRGRDPGATPAAADAAVATRPEPTAAPAETAEKPARAHHHHEEAETKADPLHRKIDVPGEPTTPAELKNPFSTP